MDNEGIEIMEVQYKTYFKITCTREQAAVTTGHRPWSNNYLEIVEYVFTKGQPMKTVFRHGQWWNATCKEGIKEGKKLVREMLEKRKNETKHAG